MPAFASWRRHLAWRSALHVAGESLPSAFFTGENSSWRSNAKQVTPFASGSASKMNFSNL